VAPFNTAYTTFYYSSIVTSLCVYLLPFPIARKSRICFIPYLYSTPRSARAIVTSLISTGITQLNSTSHPKVANARKEAQCELMYIPDYQSMMYQSILFLNDSIFYCITIY